MIDDLRPRKRWQTLEHVLSELLGREIAIFQEGTCFNLYITNGTELFDQSAERMKRTDGL
jgi:hypothetical protein